MSRVEVIVTSETTTSEATITRRGQKSEASVNADGSAVDEVFRSPRDRSR
jgi:hypothetical protein